MADQETRRSVSPNGTLIDSLRKRKGWTIEKLALEADVGMRTAQKAIAGQPVSIETLHILAEKLGVRYEDLLVMPPSTEGTHATRVSFDLEMHAALTGAGSDQIAHDFLQRFISSLQKLATPNMSAILKSVKVPTEIRYAGETETRDFMDRTYRLYTTKVGREEGFLPWKELSDIDRLRYSVSVLEAWLRGMERDHPIDWDAIRSVCKADLKLLTAEERYLLAGDIVRGLNKVLSDGGELTAIGERAMPHLHQLWEQSWLLHELEQVRAILTAVTSQALLDELAAGEA